MKSICLTSASIAMLFVLGAGAAQAQLTQISSPSGLNPLDATTPDFPGNVGDNIASPFSLSAGGNMVTFTAVNGATFFRSDPTAGTAYSPTASLIATEDANSIPEGPLQLDFASPVSEFGLLAQDTFFDFESFTVSAYDGANLLGSFTTSPVDNTSTNGQTVFLGGSSTGNLITTVTITGISTAIGGDNSFIVGAVTFGAQAVPEPSSYLFLLAGGLLLGCKRRRSS